MKKFETLKNQLGTNAKVSWKYPDWENWSVDPFTIQIMKSFVEDESIEHKMHLFPLEALTEEITVEGHNDGKVFVPMKELVSKHGKSLSHLSVDGFKKAYDRLVSDIYSEVLSHSYIKLLQKWHFNTENLEPYDFIDARESKVYQPK